ATMEAIDPTGVSAGLLVGRLMLGLAMVAHGSQKLFGWFGGYGLAGTGGFLEQLGFRPGRVYAATAAGTEVSSGLLVALGLLGPVGPALMLSVMVVAAITVHWKGGFFAQTNGIELPMLYAAGAIGLALAGPGRFSLDAVLGLQWLWAPRIAAAALIVGVAAAVANLLARRPAAAGQPVPAA
ncbi:MAG TPA: DoxX family protein, partial [Gemmatimonadales bacterium]|nr:DoxX family protein [Gemmatimonadales bacterium]